MFEASPFSGESVYAVLEVLVLIAGSLVLGVLLGFLIWGWTKRKLNELQTRITDVKGEAAELRMRESELEKQMAVLEDRAAGLEVERDKLRSRLEQVTDGIAQPVLGNIPTDDSPATNARLPIHMSAEQKEEQVESGSVPAGASVQPAATPVDISITAVRDIFGREFAQDDLELIYGIDAPVANSLLSSGIDSWRKLRETPRPLLKVILEREGVRDRAKKIKTWSRQADMAVKGEWKRLKVYQHFIERS